MPRPRKPRVVGDITGYSSRHPERFRAKIVTPVTDQPVGDAPEWLKPAGQEAWQELADNLPWLNYSHRGILEITSHLAGRVRDGTLPDSGLNLLRLCLGSLGATPADFARVGWVPPSEDEDDLDYFG